MNKGELVSSVAASAGLSKKDAEKAVAAGFCFFIFNVAKRGKK